MAKTVLQKTGRLGLDLILLYRCWASSSFGTVEPTTFLHWLLEDPLIHGARLECTLFPGFSSLLTAAGCIHLKHLVHLAGPGIKKCRLSSSGCGTKVSPTSRVTPE